MPVEVYAQRSTRKDYNKKHKTRIQDNKILMFVVLPIITVLITVNLLYIGYLNTKIAMYEAATATLNKKLDDANGYTKQVEAAIDDATTTINSMAEKMQRLEEDNQMLQEKLNNLQQQVDKTSVSPVAKVNRNTDLSVQTVMTSDRMNYIIDQWNIREGGNCRFVGHGQAFIEASKMTGLDPVYILALSANESGFGTTRIAREKNNFMGIGAYDATPYDSSFIMGDGIDQGIINGAVWVADNYYNQGQTTLHDMIYGKKLYSTSKEKWINDIVWLWNKSYEL